MSGGSNKSHYLPLDDGRITQLMRSAQQAHLHDAKSLFYGVSPDVKDSSGRTALSWVASYDWSQSPIDSSAPDRFVQFLLSKGADPNLGDRHGETPLHWAAKAGDYRMVDLFLQKDFHTDLPDHRGRTPLSWAAERGHYRVAEILLALGRADPDSKDSRGRTPLSWAAENWHRETATILLGHGASVDVRDHEGQIPLWWFINNTARRSEMNQWPLDLQEDFQQWLAMLGPNNSVEPMTKARRTFLSWACERGDIHLVKHVLQTTWADPNSIDRYRKTPLIYALEWNHYNIADILIAGVSNDSQKKDIVSLRIMVQECRSRLLKPFLERYKPNLEQEDEYNSMSLVRLALQQGDRTTVAVLLRHGASIQNLENGDWFGPCSAGKTSRDLVILNNARTGSGHSSIPLMKMAIQEGDRAAVAALLDYRARILQLEENEDDFSQYSTTKPSMAVDIKALRNRCKDARWILEDALTEAFRELPKTSEEIHLILFRENYLWRTYCQMSHIPNELFFSLGHKSPCRTFNLSIRMSLAVADDLPITYEDEKYNYESGDSVLRTIEWSVLEAPPKTIHYYSNLPSGWIPQNDLEFVQLFMNTWKDDWLSFCREGRRYLGRLRSRQLTARGKDNHLIDTIAENMLKWTQIQGILVDQLTQASNFVTEYQRFSETRQFREIMNGSINSLEKDVSSQVDKLEQIVRDLLQIEFAWVSINEAHRSTSVATSMKRLSWITFIFLPLMFASSLFGMNVDILRDDPTWRWYPLVGGCLLLLTVIVWVSTKFTNLDTWASKKMHVLSPKSAHIR